MTELLLLSKLEDRQFERLNRVAEYEAGKPRDKQTPEALAAHHKAEIEKWWPLIKAAGMKAD